MLTGGLKKTDEGRSAFDQEAADWVEFDTREKLTSTDGYEESNFRKRRNKANFQRASRKLSNITEFTQSRRNPGRTEAFKFVAFDRADAFRHVDYVPGPDVGGKGIMMPAALSVTSEQKSMEDALEQMGVEAWMGLNQGTGMTPAPSEVPESMKSSKSVADLQALEQFPGSAVDASVSDKEGLSKSIPHTSSQDSKYSTENASERMRISPVGSGEGKPPLGVRRPIHSAEIQTDTHKEASSQVEEADDVKQQAKEPEKPIEKVSRIASLETCLINDTMCRPVETFCR